MSCTIFFFIITINNYSEKKITINNLVIISETLTMKKLQKHLFMYKIHNK